MINTKKNGEGGGHRGEEEGSTDEIYLNMH
jgi:hypothetical protein